MFSYPNLEGSKGSGLIQYSAHWEYKLTKQNKNNYCKVIVGCIFRVVSYTDTMYMFTMYTYPLALISNKHKMDYHSYADDKHVYLHCDNNVASLRHAVHQLEHCIFDICDWMRRNALKPNEDQTEFVIFSTKNNLRDNQCLVVGKYKIEVSEYVKILGITFDNRMTLQKHITNSCRSVNIHSGKINSIRRYLSNTAVNTLVQSIVIARLDYCNSVCIGLPMDRLQRHRTVQHVL